MLKGMVSDAIARGLSSNAGAKSANDPPYGYPKIPVPTGDPIHVSDSEPVAETAYGKILGYSHNGVYAFKAVPYGADTSGTNRLTPTQKPAPWPGVRSCFYHGFMCLHLQRAGWKNNEEFWLFSRDDGTISEDCLNLNVWTAGLDNGKRPVMVWLYGSGLLLALVELPSYDWENLVRVS
jgi:para-nitrobenzyl esterase